MLVVFDVDFATNTTKGIFGLWTVNYTGGECERFFFVEVWRMLKICRSKFRPRFVI